MTYVIDVWLTRDGFYDGELNAPGSADDLATFTANAAKNGQGVVDKSAPGAKRPPDRPRTAEALALQTKGERLLALRAKGWAALTIAEQAEASALKFDLGQ